MIARWRRVSVLAAAVVILVLSGCAIDKTSIEDRIATFIQDANAGRYSSLYKHLHSDCGDRNAAKNAIFWDTTPFKSADAPFTVTGVSDSSTTTGTFDSNGIGAPTAITFVMKEEDKDDWFILSISIPGLAGFLLD